MRLVEPVGAGVFAEFQDTVRDYRGPSHPDRVVRISVVSSSLNPASVRGQAGRRPYSNWNSLASCFVLAIACAALLAIVAPTASAARGDPQKASPQDLWDAFPLNPKGARVTSDGPRSGPKAPFTPPVITQAVAEPAAENSRGNLPFWAVLGGAGAFVLLALLGLAAVRVRHAAGHRRRTAPLWQGTTGIEASHIARLQPTIRLAVLERTTDYPRVSIILPTLNEAAGLAQILPLIPSEHEVVVVDGGSTDGTTAVARAIRPDAQVFRQPRNGKAAALFAGFAAAHGDILITLDADGSHDVQELALFIDALVSGADFVKGSRLIEGGGSADFTRLRVAGTRALGMVANVMHGTNYTDLTYGYNGLWRHALPHVVTVADGFEGEVLMCIRAARAGLRVAEVPCFEAPRVAGASKLHAGRDGFRILGAIMKEGFASHRPAAGAQMSMPSSRWSKGNAPSVGLEPLLDDDLAARAVSVVPDLEGSRHGRD